MKRLATLFAALVLLCCGFNAQAQDEEAYKFADTCLSFQQVLSQWQDQNLYTAGWDESPTIRNYFAGFATTYLTDLTREMLFMMLGLNAEDALSGYVLDERAGYIRATLAAQLESTLQMCYWRCSDGSRLVAVAVKSEEFFDSEDGEEVIDEDGDMKVWTATDMMFYRIRKGELLWRPVTPTKLLGRKLDFNRYIIELPRQGKDILLTGSETGKVTTLKWTGNGFSIQ